MVAGALHGQPGEVHGRLEEAQCLLQNGNTVDARAEFGGVTAAAPSAAAFVGLARADWAEGRTREAWDALRRAVSVGKSSGELLNIASACSVYLDGPDGEAALRRIPDVDRTAEWHETAALLAEDKGNQATALAELSRAVSLADSSAKTRLVVELADLYWAMGRFVDALSQYERASSSSDRGQVLYAHYRAGLCEERLAEPAQAIADFEQAIRAQPTPDQEANIDLGILRSEMAEGDVPAALNFADRIDGRNDVSVDVRAQASALASVYRAYTR